MNWVALVTLVIGNLLGGFVVYGEVLRLRRALKESVDNSQKALDLWAESERYYKAQVEQLQAIAGELLDLAVRGPAGDRQ